MKTFNDSPCITIKINWVGLKLNYEHLCELNWEAQH